MKRELSNGSAHRIFRENKKKKKKRERAKLHYLSAVTAVVCNLGSRHVNLAVYRKGWDMEKWRSQKQAVYILFLCT